MFTNILCEHLQIIHELRIIGLRDKLYICAYLKVMMCDKNFRHAIHEI